MQRPVWLHTFAAATTSITNCASTFMPARSSRCGVFARRTVPLVVLHRYWLDRDYSTFEHRRSQMAAFSERRILSPSLDSRPRTRQLRLREAILSSIHVPAAARQQQNAYALCQRASYW